jgi:integrase
MLSALRGVLHFAQGNPLPLALAEVMKGNEDASGPIAGRALSPGELGKLLAAARPTMGDLRDAAMIALMAGSGLRRDSAAKLDVGDYVPETGAIVARKAKGGKTYETRLATALRPVVVRWLGLRGGDAGPLFPALHRDRLTLRRLSVDAVTDAIERLRVRAGVDPFNPHDLRRTFGTAMLDSGADVSAVASLMGHTDPKTTLRYDRRRAERLANLVDEADGLKPTLP